MDILKESKTHKNAYYLGDLIGTLQYKKDYDIIKNLLIPLHQNDNDNEEGFQLETHTEDNLRRLTPDTPTGISSNWKIILVIKKTLPNNIIIIKGALLNKDTNKIALMTTFNDKLYIINKNNRAIKSLDDNWFIGHYRMLGSLFFWKELKNRLNY